MSSAPQLAYAPPTSVRAASVDEQAEVAVAAQVTTPSSPAVSGEALLATSTLSALVAEQGVAATGPSDPPVFEQWSSYEFYMPTREGFTARALALAIDDANAVSSSAGKTDEEIATDARARLDANYARMTAGGEPFKENTFEGVDWNSLMGELDPKSLAAVQQNRGGLFTEREQTYSNMFLGIQAAMRAGAYCGPTRLMGTYYASGRSAMSSDDATKAMQAWDKDAAKDRANVGIQLGRAEMRVLLGSAAGNLFGDGMAPEDRMMSLLVEALRKAQSDDPDVMKKIGNVRTADDLKTQDWFKDYAQRFDEIRQILAEDTTAKAEPAPTA